MALVIKARVIRLLDGVLEALDQSLMQEMDLLAQAVHHVVGSLRPTTRQEDPTQELSAAIARFKQRIHSAIREYENNQEFEHYYDYLLDLAHEVHRDTTNHDFISVMERRTVPFSRHTTLGKCRRYTFVAKVAVREGKKRKKRTTRARRNVQLRDLGRKCGLTAVGHLDESPFNVLCVDAYTHRPLDNRTMFINGIDEPELRPSTQSVAEAVDRARGRDETVPPPADSSPLPNEGFITTQMLAEENFKTYKQGTVYGFAAAPNGTYSMVWAVQFSPIASLNDIEQEATDSFAGYMGIVAEHAHEVKGNRAQNGNPARGAAKEGKHKRLGRLFSTGWRPGRTEGESAGEYAPQSQRDKHDPEGYIDLHDKQDAINVAWIVMQEGLSPRAVATNIETLADAAVPLFGSHDSDIAPRMHTDRDLESSSKYYGKMFTFGQWIHMDDKRQLVDRDEIKKAIPDGFFILPGYRVAFDIGAAAVVRAIWRGGLDLHGTTTSEVDVRQGVTRWGMSIQTNKNMPKRLKSGKGEIFGAFDRLRALYDDLPWTIEAMDASDSGDGRLLSTEFPRTALGSHGMSSRTSLVSSASAGARPQESSSQPAQLDSPNPCLLWQQGSAILPPPPPPPPPPSAYGQQTFPKARKRTSDEFALDQTGALVSKTTGSSLTTTTGVRNGTTERDEEHDDKVVRRHRSLGVGVPAKPSDRGSGKGRRRGNSVELNMNANKSPSASITPRATAEKHARQTSSSSTSSFHDITHPKRHDFSHLPPSPSTSSIQHFMKHGANAPAPSTPPLPSHHSSPSVAHSLLRGTQEGWAALEDSSTAEALWKLAGIPARSHTEIARGIRIR
ncbi:hypothetical protein FRC06_011841 [Ceratobasidium sp. 370]|nr:hypothetical protein FRC06_011841 [Ceratobasidium sp. 370]